MSILRVATIEPEGATTTLTLGLAGDTVTSSADSIKVNTLRMLEQIHYGHLMVLEH